MADDLKYLMKIEIDLLNMITRCERLKKIATPDKQELVDEMLTEMQSYRTILQKNIKDIRDANADSAS